jgi:hypothetical protein
METIKNMPENARVWVYQSNRLLSEAEVSEAKQAGIHFLTDWSAHGASLKASFDILYNRFIVIAVDEQQAMASGCSIDKSVKFVKELEGQFGLNLFDRLQVAYRKENEILVSHLSEFEKLAQQGVINELTIVFNNMVSTKAAFDKEWEVPVKESWQKRVLA